MRRILGLLTLGVGMGTAVAASVVTVETGTVALDTVTAAEAAESAKTAIDTSSWDFYEALLNVPFAPHSPGMLLLLK